MSDFATWLRDFYVTGRRYPRNVKVSIEGALVHDLANLCAQQHEALTRASLKLYAQDVNEGLPPSAERTRVDEALEAAGEFQEKYD